MQVLKVKVKVKSLSHVRLFATPWTVAYQASTSMIFSRQEYWNGLPFPSPEDLPNPGIKPRSPTLEADSLTSEPPGIGQVQICPAKFYGITEMFYICVIKDGSHQPHVGIRHLKCGAGI